jgi:hypothetical protein
MAEVGLLEIPEIVTAANSLLKVEPEFDFSTVNTYDKVAGLIEGGDMKNKQSKFLTTLFQSLNLKVTDEQRLDSFQKAPSFRMASCLSFYKPMKPSANTCLRCPGDNKDLQSTPFSDAGVEEYLVLEPVCYDERAFKAIELPAFNALKVYTVKSNKSGLTFKKKKTWPLLTKVAFMKVETYKSFIDEIVKANGGEGESVSTLVPSGQVDSQLLSLMKDQNITPMADLF